MLACLLICLLACLLVCLLACLLACLLLACLLAYLLTSLRTYQSVLNEFPIKTKKTQRIKIIIQSWSPRESHIKNVLITSRNCNTECLQFYIDSPFGKWLSWRNKRKQCSAEYFDFGCNKRKPRYFMCRWMARQF